MKVYVSGSCITSIFLIMINCNRTFSQAFPGSPYSYYGLGKLNDSGVGINKVLGGGGYALRDSLSINFKNPAAYNSIQSGITQVTTSGFEINALHFSDNGGNSTYTGFSIPCFSLWFRPLKNSGINLGAVPFSNMQYEIVSKNSYNGLIGDYSVNLNGNGGLTNFFLGVSYQIINDLSAGVDFSYLFGSLIHNRQITTHNNLNDFSITEKTSLHTFHTDYGLQYTLNFPDNTIVLGATYSGGRKLTGKYNYLIYSSTDTISQTIQGENVYRIPETFGFGIEYMIHNKLMFTTDFKFDNMPALDKIPGYNLGDSRKISFGLMKIFKPPLQSSFQFESVSIGGYYKSGYLFYNGNGLYDIGVSAGVRLMISGRSLFDIIYQTSRSGFNVKYQLKENLHQLSINFTLFDIWFVKRKIN